MMRHRGGARDTTSRVVGRSENLGSVTSLSVILRENVPDLNYQSHQHSTIVPIISMINSEDNNKLKL